MASWEKFIQAGIRLPLYMHLSVEGARDVLPRLIGWQPERWLVVGERQLTTVYSDGKNQDSFMSFLQSKILTSESERKRFLTTLVHADGNLLAHCRAMYFRDYELATRSEIIADFNTFVALFRIKFALYSLPKFIDESVPKLLPTIFSQPITPELFFELVVGRELTEYSRERFTLLHIANHVLVSGLEKLFLNNSRADIIDQLGRFHPRLYHQIEVYARKFAWVPVSHHVQPLNLDQAIHAVQETLRDPQAYDEFCRLIEAVLKEKIRPEKQKIFEGIDKDVLRFFKRMNQLNESRKAAMSKALLFSYPLFQEVAERLDTDVVSVRQLTTNELANALERGRLSDDDRRVMKERLEAYVLCLEDGRIKVLGGAAAIKFIQSTFPPVAQTAELRGNVANPGYAEGRVRLILSENQIEHLQEGEILVTSMTDPDMVPAMKKAAAIVTDEGGITCHAAIVSRELNKPCVVGTKIATKIFKDGDVLVVDANKGIITKKAL